MTDIIIDREEVERRRKSLTPEERERADKLLRNPERVAVITQLIKEIAIENPAERLSIDDLYSLMNRKIKQKLKVIEEEEQQNML